MKTRLKAWAQHLPPGPRSALYRGWDTVRIASEFYVDYRRFVRYGGRSDNAAGQSLSGVHLEAQLTKDYHRIEKGLSLRDPRRPFGKTVSERLRRFVEITRRDAFFTSSEVPHHVGSALEALEGWNREGAKTVAIVPEGPRLRGIEDPEEFFSTRHSVRSFDAGQRITVEQVRRANVLAMHAPSVCNRQAGRAHFFARQEDVSRILGLQKGSSGFTDSVTDVFVVTVEAGLFTGAGERNQRWIDGSLFAMTLVWALHGMGLGSCMLNWSKTSDLSKKLRAAVDIPSSEDVIAVIAVGTPEEGYRVARSPRRDPNQVLRIHA